MAWKENLKFDHAHTFPSLFATSTLNACWCDLAEGEEKVAGTAEPSTESRRGLFLTIRWKTVLKRTMPFQNNYTNEINVELFAMMSAFAGCLFFTIGFCK